MAQSPPHQKPAERPHSSGPLELVLETALDAVVIMNSDGTVADWNDRAAEVFGWQRTEAVGRVMAELIIPEAMRETHSRGLQRYLNTGDGPILRQRIEVVGLRKSGEEFPVELSVSPVHDQGHTVFVGCLRDISERKRAEEQQRLLLDEVNHRVKNMLQVVASIAAQTARTSDSMPEFSQKFVARLHALSRTHSMLSAGVWGTTQLKALILEFLAPHAEADTRCSLNGPQVALKPAATMALGLILHELVTNAAKYGALSTAQGTISIHWDVRGEPRQVELNWHEAGVPDAPPPSRSGFGTRLIEASTRHDLHGELAVEYSPDGVRYDLRFPLE